MKEVVDDVLYVLEKLDERLFVVTCSRTRLHGVLVCNRESCAPVAYHGKCASLTEVSVCMSQYRWPYFCLLSGESGDVVKNATKKTKG